MQVRTEYKIAQFKVLKKTSLNMRLKTFHISNRTRVPERWRCYHKSSIT